MRRASLGCRLVGLVGLAALATVAGCSCGGGVTMGGDDAALQQDDLLGADLAGADLKPLPDLLPAVDLNGAPDGIACPAGPTQSCYGGTVGTAGKGVCHAGIQYCTGAGYGPCTGDVIPSTESCNNLDDDCNGMTDDGLGMVTCGVGSCKSMVNACTGGKPTACTPGTAVAENCANTSDDDCDGIVNNGCGCTYVSPMGSDMTGTGNAAAPFQTITHAISQAGMNGLPKMVCVASMSATCGPSSPSVATYNEAITMVDGVSVYGGYRYDPTMGGQWTRIGGTLTLQVDGSVTLVGCATIITAKTDQGVVFPQTVTTPTSLDGFTVAGTLSQTNPTAAITVTGSTGAVINNNIINGGGVGTTSSGVATYGINVDGATKVATPQITSNSIVGGTGTISMGVRSFKSAPVIQDHCSIANNGNAYDSAGRCVQYGCGSSCYNAVVRRFIRGRPFNGNPCAGATPPPSTETYAVRLIDSDNAVVARNALCSSTGQGDTAAVRLSGPSSGVLVRANNLSSDGAGTGNVNSVGLWADSCNGAAPWVLDNARIAGGSRSLGARGDGIRAIGDCHPRIDSNVLIIGGEESANNDAYGVYCARDPQTGITSRCTILNNNDIFGSGGGFPPIAAGVRCDNGGCARIENNTRITARSGIRTFGVILDSTGTFVGRNGIDAGCARVEGIGLHSLSSWARVENNVIGGSRWTGGNNCSSSTTSFAVNSYAVRAVLGNGQNEIELHSNDLFALGTPSVCTSRAIGFDVDLTRFPAPTGPRGVVRNNFLHAGLCQTAYDVDEMNTAADPRIFENNDLWANACGATVGLPCSATAATALYRDEAMTNHTMLTNVNGMTDIATAKNLNTDPAFVALSFATSPASPATMPPSIDVRIQSSSMLGDNGTSSGLPPLVDFYNTARPIGTAIDIGAHEHP